MLGAASFRADFERKKRLAFLAQNLYDIGRGAGAQANQDKLHRAGRGVALAIGIDHDRMAAGGAADKALAIGPVHRCINCFRHLYLRLSVLGSG